MRSENYKKKVMILGAGEGQVSFIKICKDRGYKVLVVSIKGDYPGFALADKKFYYDTRDKDAILKIAEDEKIDAIITDQTDVAIPTVAYVSEKLGLRGIGYDTAIRFTNKYYMRQAAREAGIAVPQFEKAKTIEEAIRIAQNIGFPLMIKPVDNSGSRGVIKIESMDELVSNFECSKNFSSVGDVIVERFITGTSYMVNGFAMDNDYINLDLGTKDQFRDIDIYVTKELKLHSAGSINNPIWEKVLLTNKQLVKSMGLRFGITHADYLYNELEDRVYLVEIACRGGGTFISSDITPLATGFDSNSALIDYVVEGKSSIPEEKKLQGKVCGYIRFGLPKGIIQEVRGIEEISQLKGVVKACLNNIEIGKETNGLRNDTDAYGPIIFSAENDVEADLIKKRVKEVLQISVKTMDGIQNIIW